MNEATVVQYPALLLPGCSMRPHACPAAHDHQRLLGLTRITACQAARSTASTLPDFKHSAARKQRMPPREHEHHPNHYTRARGM